MLRSNALIPLALALASAVLADPQIGFPFEDQLPTVGRVNEPYEFTLNSETFKSASGEAVTYNATNLPNWLSFDSSSLVLSGQPTTAGTVTFTLTGEDSTGQASQDCEILVTKDSGPELKSMSYIYSQLAAHYNTNGYDGIVLKPNEDFSIKFANDTFINLDSQSVTYYGRAANRTSLPNWMMFNPDTLTFSGTAPYINSVDAAAQEFDFVLIATDYKGYTSDYGTFSIIVGGHYLVTRDSSERMLNGTAGKNVSTTISLDSIYLDGSRISSSNVSSVDLYGGPAWMSIDDNYTLSGTIPSKQYTSETLNVTISDVYGDSVFIPYKLQVLNSVFTTDQLSSVNATRGDYFSYQVPTSELTSVNDTTLSANYSGASWLSFHGSNRTFNGQVPSNFDSTTVTLNGEMGEISNSEKFTIKGVDGKTKTTSSSSSSTATSTPTSSSSSSSTASPTSTSSSASKSKKSGVNKKLAIGLGAGLGGLFLVVLTALLLFCCCFKRNKHDDDDDEESTHNMNKQNSNTTLNGGPAGAAAGGAFGDKNVAQMDGASLSSGSSDATNVGVEEEKKDGQVQNSWRNKNRGANGNGQGWRPHDSLSSLATVTTNDLLTVNVVDDPNLQRRSQMNLMMKRNSQSQQQSQQQYRMQQQPAPAGNLSNTNLITSYKNSRVAQLTPENSTSSGRLYKDASSGYLSSEPSSNIELLGSSSSTNSRSNPNSNRNLRQPDTSGRLAPNRDISNTSNTTNGSSVSAKLVDFTGKPAIQHSGDGVADSESFQAVLEDSQESL